MKISIPKEIKPRETRVALNPHAAAGLCRAGHAVQIEHNAGLVSGYSDEQYQQAGASIAQSAAEVYDFGELILKVKEPIEADLALLRSEHTLFSFLHLAALPDLTARLCDIGLTALAFESVIEDHQLPILKPMSQIAGKLAIQLGTHWLHSPQGGKGLLLGGLSGVSRGSVVVIGAGNAGGAAAMLAARLGAKVTVFDKSELRLQQMRALADNIETLFPYPELLASAVTEADLLVGAVLVPGAQAPQVINQGHIQQMQAGSVVVDISIDQGGCIETSHATDYDNPTYRVHDIVHAGITNLPAAVGRSATDALSNAVLPYATLLAEGALQINPVLAQAVNVAAGDIVLPALQ